MQITRDFLSQYIYLESEIKRIDRRLEYYKDHPLISEHGVVKGSMGQFPYAECHFVVSAPRVLSDEERQKKIRQLVIDLEGNKSLYEDMKLEIEGFLETLSDMEMKSILKMKYVDRKRDCDIARELGYERSTVTKKIDSFFKGK